MRSDCSRTIGSPQGPPSCRLPAWRDRRGTIASGPSQASGEAGGEIEEPCVSTQPQGIRWGFTGLLHATALSAPGRHLTPRPLPSHLRTPTTPHHKLNQANWAKRLRNEAPPISVASNLIKTTRSITETGMRPCRLPEFHRRGLTFGRYHPGKASPDRLLVKNTVRLIACQDDHLPVVGG